MTVAPKARRVRIIIPEGVTALRFDSLPKDFNIDFGPNRTILTNENQTLNTSDVFSVQAGQVVNYKSIHPNSFDYLHPTSRLLQSKRLIRRIFSESYSPLIISSHHFFWFLDVFNG
jgi:hypothetical protein